MCNICYDEIYFLSDTNSYGLQLLWNTLQSSVLYSSEPESTAIKNIFVYGKDPYSNLYLQGSIIYMGCPGDTVFIIAESA